MCYNDIAHLVRRDESEVDMGGHIYKCVADTEDGTILKNSFWFADKETENTILLKEINSDIANEVILGKKYFDDAHFQLYDLVL